MKNAPEMPRYRPPIGAIVLVNCARRSSSSAGGWCRKKNKHHVDLELRGVVCYDPETDGKKIRYIYEDWLEAKQPRGREVFEQEIVPHFPKLKDIAHVICDHGGDNVDIGDKYWKYDTQDNYEAR